MLADLLGNASLLHWVHKVLVCDLWLVDLDPFCEFLCFKIHCLWSYWRLQSNQVKCTPKESIYWIYYSKVESVASCRFQIDLCILACVMSREFTREAVMKFLPAQFSWIWCKCLLRNLIHSKIFNLTKYREVLVKYSLLITHAEMPLWIWHQLGERLTASFQIIDSLIESWGVRLTFLECNGSEKRNCEGGFWALKFACFEKPSDLYQKSTYCNELPSKTINVTTHIVWITNLISTLPTTWLLPSRANTHVSLFESFFSTDQA